MKPGVELSTETWVQPRVLEKEKVLVHSHTGEPPGRLVQLEEAAGHWRPVPGPWGYDCVDDPGHFQQSLKVRPAGSPRALARGGEWAVPDVWVTTWEACPRASARGHACPK